MGAIRIGFDPASAAGRHLRASEQRFAVAAERLSTGLRVSRARDDPAGHALSEKMRVRASGLAQAGRNVQDGVSLIQTADGALATTHALLSRARELAVQAATGTLGDAERDMLQDEASLLLDEMDRLAVSTRFNGVVLLDGTFAGAMLQVGANRDTGNGAETISLATGMARPQALGDTAAALGLMWGNGLLATALDSGDATYSNGNVVFQTMVVTDQASARTAIQLIDLATDQISALRASLGATSNQLDHHATFLAVSGEQTVTAAARIRDADVAQEVASLVREQVRRATSIQVQAQSNVARGGVLSLLQPLR